MYSATPAKTIAAAIIYDRDTPPLKGHPRSPLKKRMRRRWAKRHKAKRRDRSKHNRCTLQGVASREREAFRAYYLRQRQRLEETPSYGKIPSFLGVSK